MTDAQRRANDKYRSTQDLVQIRLPKGARQRLKDAADLVGLSLNEYLSRLILQFDDDLMSSYSVKSFATGSQIYLLNTDYDIIISTLQAYQDLIDDPDQVADISRIIKLLRSIDTLII